MFCHGGPDSPVDDSATRGRPKCRFSTAGIGNIVQVATTPVPEPELITVEVEERPTTGHLEKTVLYSFDDYFTGQPVTPSLSASGGDQQTLVSTTLPPLGSASFYTVRK